MQAASYTRGLWYGVAAYTIWGLSPLYWKALDDVDSLQVLANRVVWAVPVLALVIVLRHRSAVMRRVVSDPRTVVVAVLAAVFLAVNWGIFIWGVATDHVVEISLGYFINPLISVALGVVVLRERLRPGQMLAVALAAAGVLYMTIRVGSVPWISLVLAFSFAMYGLLKKRPEAAPALEGLTAEVAVVAVPATVWIVAQAATGDSALGEGAITTSLLIGAGAFTAFPLLLFGASAQRIPLSLVGLLQYITPTLQFLLGVLAFGEAVGGDELVGFALVWCGLGVFTVDNVRNARTKPVAVDALAAEAGAGQSGATVRAAPPG
jgi:chloramphenicol-sensitive protein RarD